MPRRVPGRGDDLQRADAVAGREAPRDRGGDIDPAAGDLVLRLTGIERAVAREQPRLALGGEHLDATEGVGHRIERADMVGVPVGEEDAHDRRAERLRGRQDALRAAAGHRVDEGEPVVLADEVGVDEAEAAETGDVRGDGGRSHERLLPIAE